MADEDWRSEDTLSEGRQTKRPSRRRGRQRRRAGADTTGRAGDRLH